MMPQLVSNSDWILKIFIAYQFRIKFQQKPDNILRFAFLDNHAAQNYIKIDVQNVKRNRV